MAARRRTTPATRPKAPPAESYPQRERGQAMAETALTVPLVMLMLAGVLLAGIVVYRTAASGWGVFVYATGAGAFRPSGEPAPVAAVESVPWGDLGSGLGASNEGRTVRTRIDVRRSKSWVEDIHLFERQSGGALTRQWDFYAGRPEGPWD